MVKTVSGPAFVMFGLVVGCVGFTMWRSPNLNWSQVWDEGGVAARAVWNEVSRMVDEPVAWIGLLVMVVGLAVLAVGTKKVRMLIFGR